MVNESCRLKTEYNDAREHLSSRLVGVASEYDGVAIKPSEVHTEVSKTSRVVLMGRIMEDSLHHTRA